MDAFNIVDQKGWPENGPGELSPVSLSGWILELGLCGVAVVDEGGLCVYANREMARITGYPAPETVGRKLSGFLASDEEAERLMNPAPQAPSFDARFVHRDGGQKVAETTVRLFHTETGATLRIVIVYDITEHRKVVRELSENELKYRLLVENIEEFFFEQNLEGGFSFFNEAMVRHSGFTREELGVMTFRDYILPEDWGRVEDFYTRILKTGKPASGLKIRGRMKDGSVHYYEVRSNLKTDGRGRKVGFRSYCRDVTAEILYEKEQRKRESQMLKMQQALEGKVRERTRELQDINTALEVLLKKRENDKQDLENRITFSIKEMIVPHIELLKKTELSKHQAMYLEILEQNFQEICSPFMQLLSDSLRKLTPTEIQIVNLIKQNKSSKQIADFLGISPRTVEFHRDNVRKKLGIKNKKVNLRTYLLST